MFNQLPTCYTTLIQFIRTRYDDRYDFVWTNQEVSIWLGSTRVPRAIQHERVAPRESFQVQKLEANTISPCQKTQVV